MPRRNGWELLEAIRLQRKDLPVLIMTGYNPHRIVADKSDKHIDFLLKPFRVEELLSVLETLTSPSSSMPQQMTSH
jgi:DNA-binding NtrC family response regulator